MYGKCPGKIDMKFIETLWEGEGSIALTDDLRNKKLELSIVSQCYHTLYMDLIRNYISMDNKPIMSTALITCPKEHGQDFGANTKNLK